MVTAIGLLKEVAVRSRPKGELTRRVIHSVADLVYRDIDTHSGDASVLASGPIIAVSNHFGGLADGVLLVDALPRMPRVVARDLIWKVPVVGRLATALGGIPVHRSSDAGQSKNDEMFASCYGALRAGDLVLIFPEGVTQDVPHMAEVKTGVARIALGARESGVTGIRVVPIGLHYENKSGFRSRALVNVGEAIDLDNWLSKAGVVVDASDHALVQSLTADVDQRLRLAAPDFPDWDTTHDFALAADVVLHDVDASSDTVRYGDQSLLSGHLHRSGEPDGSTIQELAAGYRADLASQRVSDLRVARMVGDVRPKHNRKWAWELFLLLLLLPYAIAGALLWIVPWLIMQAVRLVPIAPAEKATLMPAAAFLVFTVQWGFLIWESFTERGGFVGALAILLPPLFLAAFLLVSEQVVLLGRRFRLVRRIKPDNADRLMHSRRELSDATWRAL
jgi:1-acyl-sn-glycerol-3-phosphate acyltransferase